MPAPPAVIVGPGRSGSGYIAGLLNACAVACGHEGWWNPHGGRTDGLDCDSSWCALALGGLPEVVLAQFRHPIAVYSSLLHEPPPAGPYRQLRLRLLPNAPGDAAGFALAATVAYTQAALSRCSDWWRVEDINAPMLARICGLVGRPVPEVERAAAAVAAVPRTVNRHTWLPELGWDEIPTGRLRSELLALAEELGYD